MVIKGWELGVATMNRGEIAEFYCRSDYTAGETGDTDLKIPQGKTVKFEIELLDWTELPSHSHIDSFSQDSFSQEIENQSSENWSQKQKPQLETETLVPRNGIRLHPVRVLGRSVWG